MQGWTFFKTFSLCVLTFLSLIYSAQAQDKVEFKTPAMWQQGDKEKYNLSTILMNRLEIVDIHHKKQTKLHARARLTVNKVFDPTKKVSTQTGTGGFLKEIPEFPTEYYAGGYAKTKYKFSLEIERYKNGNVKKIKEIVINGLDEAGHEKVTAQVSTFDNAQKLENITNCSGHLSVEKTQGDVIRLLGEKDKSFQSFLKCKTVTNDICKKVNSGLGTSYQHTRHRANEGDPALMGYLQIAYQDTYEFKPAQEENSNEIKDSLAPGGSLRYGRWPSSEHHNMKLQNKSDAYDREQTDWAFDTCKSVAAMVNPRYVQPSLGIVQKYLEIDASIQRLNSAAVDEPGGSAASNKKSNSK